MLSSVRAGLRAAPALARLASTQAATASSTSSSGSAAAAVAATAAPLVAPVAPPSSPLAEPLFGPSTSPSGRIRGKNAFKRASSVMLAVTREGIERMNVKMATSRAPLDSFRVGDAIEVSYAMEAADAQPLPVRGTVMGKWNKGVNSKFTIVNSLEGEWYTASYVYSSPLLRGLRVMQKNRVHDGLRQARRAKLTHLLHADHQSFIVGANTKEASVLQAEKEARKALQRAGKPLKKTSERSKLDPKDAAKGKTAPGTKGTPGAAKAGAKAAPAAAKKK